MSAPAAQHYQLRCHHCQQWVGESSQPMEFVGVFKSPRDRDLVDGPRDTRRCKACGWVTVFRPVGSDASARRDWRTVELKTG